MAYGVKYRLEFSDVLGNGKKVEILQDGYTGDVLPMIGTGNPVEITWDEDDDFYEPIIGSSCKLNLMVTDDVSYDNFWEGDEFEYKVIVYYAQKQVDEFVNRVEQFAESGNGRIEVPECIESIFTQNITISSEFRQRVQEDGGVVDSLSCITNIITDSEVKNYEVFWQGFLYVDGFQESFSTKPYPIVLKALDGLGTLNGYDPPIIGNNPPINGFFFPYLPFTRGEYDQTMNILNNLNLDMDLYWQGESQVDPATPTDVLRHWTSNLNIEEDGELIDAKSVLRYILKQSNSRIFQAFGKWYVVKNSKYLDSVFEDQYYDRSVFKLALGNGQNEIIDFSVFRYEEYEYTFAGVDYTYDATIYKGKADHNVSRRVRADLQPLHNDMVVEYLPPLKKVITTSDQKRYNRFLRTYFYAADFEFGTDYVASYGSVDSHDIVEKGDKSYKLTNAITTQSYRVTALDAGGTADYDTLITYQTGKLNIDFSYYIDSTNTSPNYKIQYAIKIDHTPLLGTPTTSYYDVENATYGSSIVYNEIGITDKDQLNTWRTKSISADAFFYDVNVHVIFYFTYVTSYTGYNALYLDNINIYQDLVNPDNKILDAKRDVNSGIYENDLLPAESFREYNNGELGDLQNNAQEILNDYRNFVPRYEGTFYNNNSKPITPLCKPYIDFGTEFQGYQSEMVDGMRYNVKANEYSLIMHTSNNDPDVTATFQKKT